jgi:peptidase MA superfamily protein
VGIAATLADDADRAAVWPGLGRRSVGRIRLILVPDEARFIALTGGRAPIWGAGVAEPGAHTILLRADVGDLERTLRHELAHLVLHDAVQVPLPRWFDEGYASWAAGEWDRVAALALNMSVARGAIPELDDLNADLRGGVATATPAYALAMSAVVALAQRNPTGTLTPLLDRLRAGTAFDVAVRQTTGLTLAQFNRDWVGTVHRRYGLVTWLAAGGLWAVIATVVLALSGVRKRADRPRRAALDDGWIIPSEDEAEPELDPARGP